MAVKKLHYAPRKERLIDGYKLTQVAGSEWINVFLDGKRIGQVKGVLGADRQSLRRIIYEAQRK